LLTQQRAGRTTGRTVDRAKQPERDSAVRSVHLGNPDLDLGPDGRNRPVERSLRDEPVDVALDCDEGPDVVNHAADGSGEDLPDGELLLQYRPRIFLAGDQRVGDPAVERIHDERPLDAVADFEPAAHVGDEPGHLDVGVAQDRRGPGLVVHAHDHVLALDPVHGRRSVHHVPDSGQRRQGLLGARPGQERVDLLDQCLLQVLHIVVHEAVGDSSCSKSADGNDPRYCSPGT
jgi:hypothetical protein